MTIDNINPHDNNQIRLNHLKEITKNDGRPILVVHMPIAMSKTDRTQQNIVFKEMRRIFGNDYKVIAIPGRYDVTADNSTIVHLQISDTANTESVLQYLRSIAEDTSDNTLDGSNSTSN